MPTVWLLNRDIGDSSASGDTVAETTAPPVASTPTTENDASSPVTNDPMALDESIYLSGDGTEQPDLVVDVAVPAAEQGEVMSARATFSRNFTAAALCVGGPDEVGTVLTVTNVGNGKTIKCKVGDRGPFVQGRVVDLSRYAFSQLASPSAGVISVKISW